MVRKRILLIMLAALAGCTQIPRDGGFGEVEETVDRHTGMKVRWNTAAVADALVAEGVESMLADELTADEAVQIALLNNRHLQATFENLGIARADLIEAALPENPVYDLETLLREGREPIFEMKLTQNFIGILLIPLKMRLKKAELERVKKEVTGAVFDLALRTRQTCYLLQLNKLTLAVQEKQLLARKQSYEAAKRLREAGNLKELDVLIHRARYERMKLQVAGTEVQVQQTRERLNALMGLYGANTDWQVTAALPPVPKEDPPRKDLERRAILASPHFSPHPAMSGF